MLAENCVGDMPKLVIGLLMPSVRLFRVRTKLFAQRQGTVLANVEVHEGKCQGQE
jgi:hypothetical protein